MHEEKLLELKCSSVFAPFIIDFVEQKRALGYKYNAGVEVFNEFDSFCRQHELSSPTISKEFLSLWEGKRSHENETTQLCRISYVRTLCKHLCNNGYDIPGAFHSAPKKSREFVPYIFTKDEMERLFVAADKTTISVASPLRHLVMPVLFRLIYACGLRVSEAAKIRLVDVDLSKGVMTIYGAKGDKDRMVGISDSMLSLMVSYRNNPLISKAKSEYLFPAPDGGYYDSSTLYSYFREYLFVAGIPHKGRGKGPRVHDLRHSFAVHILNKWSNDGKDLYTCIPVLRMYLGHSRITATEKYLRLVSEAYGELTTPFIDRFSKITERLEHEANL